MGFSRLCLFLSVSFVFAVTACGDNDHKMFEDAGVDTMGPMPDGPPDAPPDALMCGANEMICSNICVNTQTDNDNCGSCGNDCGTGTCQQGLCCPAGQMNCGGVCVDVSADEAHCGNCTTTCTSQQTCQNGTCCGGGTTVCGNQCFDLMTDEGHCGSCTIACTAGETCESGLCCPTGQINCGGVCKDPQTDETACGDCNTMCTTGQSCTNGDCCTTGETSCNGVCKNLNTDETACGNCNTMCTTGQTCTTRPDNSDPKCCTTGQNNCGGTCSDPMTDEQNCGVCGTACAQGETCSGGKCCGPGQINCNGTCVDPLTDAQNCSTNGTCGNVCSGTTPVCNGGACSGSCDPGFSNCSGDCVNTQTDHNNCGGCGLPCGPNQVCSGGSCATMCPAGSMNCNGSCVDVLTDPNHCGNCTTVCSLTQECVAGGCQKDCPSGESLCGGPNGTCHNFLNDELACGNCQTQCATGQTCTNGVCCGPGEINCNGVCKNPTTDEMNCGGCGITCGGTETCTNGSTGPECCTTGFNNCGGTCSDPMNDENNCGGCNLACSTGQTCSSGKCCTDPLVNKGGICCLANEINCNGTCVNPLTDPLHCSDCNEPCGMNEFCNSGQCEMNCDPPNNTTCGICTNTSTDPDACGATCADCPTGADCIPGGTPGSGTCETCAQADPTKPNVCNNTCTNILTDPSNCGMCNKFCQSGETCQAGICCGQGLTACNGQCINTLEDENNCGQCGEVCDTGSTCVNGSCQCAFGQIDCPNGCKTPSVDPLNCGACGNICGAPPNGATEIYCVSNECVATCPAPLVGCGTGPNAECVNTESDNDNCGGCGIKCTGTQGCAITSQGPKCVEKLSLGPDPAKCIGGGPPISVPTGGGQQTCSGNLGSTSFTFGLCSRTNIGPLSAELFSDAFDSTKGAYKATCTSSADCNGLPCVGDPANGYAMTCAGGGVGVNGTVGPVANNTARIHVGGDFWAFGMIGLDFAGDVTVKQRLLNEDDLAFTKLNRVFGTATVGGTFSSSGGAAGTDLKIDGLLTYGQACPPAPNDVTLGAGCVGNTAFPNLLDPCGTAADLIPVRDIVEHFRNPANNDNAAIGLAYNALAAPSNPVRIELPCGYYYLDSLGGNQSVTLVVKGRTALFIGGAADINVDMNFQVEPTASLDMFIGGVVRIAQPITIGSPAYPRLTRVYVGNSSVAGGGSPCTSVSQCGSGVCTACSNAPFAPCSGSGTCTGGGNLSESIFMSQGGSFNGLFWAGYGEFDSSNFVEMYGSIFSNYIDNRGGLKIHYDNGAVTTGDECPPTTGSCESCRDCNNQACINNSCGACTNDSQCCPPLRCNGSGQCVL